MKKSCYIPDVWAIVTYEVSDYYDAGEELFDYEADVRKVTSAGGVGCDT